MTPLLLIGALLVGCGDAETTAPAPPPAPAPADQAKAKAKAKAAPAPAEAPAKPAEPADGAAPAAAPAAAANDAGKKIYNQYCIACHGVDGKGNNGLGGDYAKVLPGKSAEDLIKSVKEGKSGTVGVMPPWGGTLSDDQIKSVVAYVTATYGPK